MKSIFIDHVVPFTEDTLAAFWAHREYGISEDHITAFIGPNLSLSLPENAVQQDPLCTLQLHLIVEHANLTYSDAIHRHYLILHMIKDALDPALEIKDGHLVLDGLALTVNDVRYSPNSTSLHVGLLIEPDMAVFPGIGLAQLDVSPKALAFAIMHAYMGEISCIQRTVTQKDPLYRRPVL